MENAPTISSIPNLELLTDNVLNFIEFFDNPKIQELKKNQPGNFNYLVNEKFNTLPVSMIKLLSDLDNRESNLEKILEMITLLKSVQTGNKSFENAENEFVEKRAEEYLYPSFGGKENFYKVAEENKKNQEKK